MISHIDINNIITKDHHGSCKGHSIASALTSIYHLINNHYYDNDIISIIQTDLSAAFDMVDHAILL